MSSSTFRFQRNAWRSEAAGQVGSRTHPPEGSFTAREGQLTEVRKDWKPVLHKVILDLGGSKPMYRMEESGDAMYLRRVSFTIPLNGSRSQYDTVSVTGNKCFSLADAESDAAVTALQRFACGIYNTKVIDISLMCYEHKKNKFQGIFRRAKELQLALDMVLTEWFNCTQQVERTCELMLSKVPQHVYGRSIRKMKRIWTRVGKQLYDIGTVNRKRYNELVTSAGAIRTNQLNAHESASFFFDEYLIPREERYHGEFPSKIKLSMCTVIFEMMVSLGWTEPKYTLLSTVATSFVYVIELSPSDANAEKLRIEGTEDKSEEEAMENTAMAAIVKMEKLMSICLVDLNYNKRSVADEHVAAAISALKNTCSLVKATFIEWEEELDDLSICDEHCRNIMADHVMKVSCNGEYNAKWECAEAVAELFSSCAAAFKHGRRRHIFFLHG